MYTFSVDDSSYLEQHNREIRVYQTKVFKNNEPLVDGLSLFIRDKNYWVQFSRSFKKNPERLQFLPGHWLFSENERAVLVVPENLPADEVEGLRRHLEKPEHGSEIF